MLTTTAFDRSSSRWSGISDLIAEPEGPSPPSSVQLRTAVWTDDARDARHFDAGAGVVHLINRVARPLIRCGSEADIAIKRHDARRQKEKFAPAIRRTRERYGRKLGDCWPAGIPARQL